MEEKRESKDKIFKKLQQLIDEINNLYPEEKISLEKNNKKWVSNVCVCIYNGNCVGLFRKTNWRKEYDYGRYDSGSTYIGVDSNCVAVHQTHLYCRDCNTWLEEGKMSGNLIVNCTINKIMEFDQIRLEMYTNGLINTYELGKATKEEILEVLKYVRDKYFIVDTKKKTKTNKRNS